MIAKPEKLHGKLEGFLEFRNDAILIGENKIELSAVKELFIVNDDYYMMPNGNGKGFTSSLSNGVQNELSLKLNDGTKITTSFQLFNEYDMGKIQNILTHYYLSGKMTFENLAKVLKLSRSETSQMKNYFQNSHIL
ncbi:MAG: hypothetical protein CFE23_16295 [Flavobacterium sp. BFFFF1]|nr:MAG: hypothetical protein CFE23_16295 [Flavobacterium sp. BFFFF1]